MITKMLFATVMAAGGAMVGSHVIGQVLQLQQVGRDMIQLSTPQALANHRNDAKWCELHARTLGIARDATAMMSDPAARRQMTTAIDDHQDEMGCRE